MDFKSAEQQVRETLGWWIEKSPDLWNSRWARCYKQPNGETMRVPATGWEKHAWDALVSKTAELLEMTAQITEQERICGQVIDERDHWETKLEELAEAAGCREEWSNLHEHGDCVVERISELEKQLAEMTAQRDETQKALEIVDEALKECCDERREFHDQLKKALGVAEDGRIWFGAGLLRAVEAVRTRAETAERERGESWATIREQAERIKELEKVKAAAECIRHWHDSGNDGMVVSGEHVVALWKALRE